MKYCPQCKRTLSLDCFASNKAKKDRKASQCKECKKKIQSEWYKQNSNKHKENIKNNKEVLRVENREKILEYLSNHPCVDCGETDPIVLEFDHVSDKKAEISSLMTRSWKVILNEIAKCEVRCANCHRRKTAKQLKWYRWVKSFNGEALNS